MKSQNKEYENNYFPHELIGNSKNILTIKDQIEKIAIQKVEFDKRSIRLRKELVARKIHKKSKNKNAFIILNGALQTQINMN